MKYVEPYLYLNDDAIANAKQNTPEVQDIAARAIAKLEGVYAAYTRTQILAGQLPATALGARLNRAFYPKRSGDVLLVAETGWFSEDDDAVATTHGSAYEYDTHVPLLIYGAEVRRGTYRDEVGPADIAPTLCELFGINHPSACDGQMLPIFAR